jgi:diguanylate cyclase (GGDEF)-like protein
VFTSSVFLLFLVWNAYSSYQVHQTYQVTLMDSVTNNILVEYQEKLSKIRLGLDEFQIEHQETLEKLISTGEETEVEAYMDFLRLLQDEDKEIRLFSVVDNKGTGIYKNITGDFLPDCQEEIASVVTTGSQEQLFLHRSKTSVHFDILRPVITSPVSNQNTSLFLFVAFNTTIFENLLRQYKLPHQELFLLRQDHVGKIELSSQDASSPNSITMSEQDIAEFNFIKAIPGTRWQIAIRLSDDYNNSLQKNSFASALTVWFLITLFIYFFHFLQQKGRNNYKRLAAELEFNETHDKLTGLSNRAEFERILKAFINDESSDGFILFVDIDQFQLINNSFGFAVGDQCLNNISRQLKRELVNGASISRLGNDEFAMLIPALKEMSSQQFSEVIRKKIQSMRFNEINREIRLTASIGILTLDHQHKTVEQVFNCLSHAVNLAKTKGRNRVQLYQSDDENIQQHAEEMNVVKSISKALDNNQFVLYRQVIQKTNPKSAAPHYEVLVRMKGDDGKLIPPNTFIPSAEKYGLIAQLDRWVIKAALNAISKLPDDDQSTFDINLSGVTLGDRDIIEYVSNLFDEFHVAPERIGFEITETYAITHLKSAKLFIQSMANLGCQFALDDFGVGISSFSYLRELPVNTIKIDGSFLQDIESNQLSYVFVEMIQKVASQLGKKTVAEFVENQGIQDIATQLNIDYLQGFHIHKPEFWFEY